MDLYTERNGLRSPKDYTYQIDVNSYSLLFLCCKKYRKCLTHLFPLEAHENFTNRDYLTFNEKQFENRIKLRIPTLFKNSLNEISEPTNSDEYDQYALLDFIEYIAKNMKDISERWNNETYRNYREITCLNTSSVFLQFQNEINSLFDDAGLLFKLTDAKLIERIDSNYILPNMFETKVPMIQEYGIKELLEDAINLYKTPHPWARQSSVEKIWDALERLISYYIKLGKKKSIEKIVEDMGNGEVNFVSLFDDEFRYLTKIGNNYRIRHHETDKIDINDSHHYDYFFNRCLSLIALSLKYLE
ncbi:hypothetical protein HYO62_03005 [Aerococcaceae bacterium DSM 111022]|nr:hypothetical protein [Aerococcaceae bacterium DSM 111022]